MQFNHLTPQQNIECNEALQLDAARQAESARNVLREFLKQDRPDPRTIQALALNYAHHARAEQAFFHTVQAVKAVVAEED